LTLGFNFDHIIDSSMRFCIGLPNFVKIDRVRGSYDVISIHKTAAAYGVANYLIGFWVVLYLNISGRGTLSLCPLSDKVHRAQKLWCQEKQS